jgi:CelD/BcsL family acetyltransferase involved in cellulose biosynthesis
MTGLTGDAPPVTGDVTAAPQAALAAWKGEVAASPDRDEIVADPLALEALKDEWDALYDRAEEPYFSQSFRWCWTSWLTVSAPRGRRLHCVVARQDGRAVLIWPFVVHPLGSFTMARPLGPETTEYTGILVEPGPEAQARIARAWQLLRATCRADVIALPLVRAGSALHRLLQAQTIPAFVERDPTSYVRRADYKDWEAYEHSLNGKARRELRRTRRRLEEKGKLVFEPIVEADACERAVDWMLRHKRQWAIDTGARSPWLRTSEYENFLVAIAKEAAPENRVFISLLRSGDEIVVADMFRLDRQRVEDFLTAYDPSFAAYGPGQMLQVETVKWAFAEGRDFDFRLGSESYKNVWVSSFCDVFSYEFSNSGRGRLYILVRKAQGRVNQLRVMLGAWRRKLTSSP